MIRSSWLQNGPEVEEYVIDDKSAFKMVKNYSNMMSGMMDALPRSFQTI